MTTPAGRPGPRWEGDGALGRPLDAAPIEREARDAPVMEPPPPLSESGQEYASFWRRLAAYAIDELIKTSFLVLVILPVAAMFGAGSPPDPDDPMSLMPRLVFGAGVDWILWAQGWTPGCGVMRLRIVRADGSPPGLRAAGARVLMSFVSALALLVGYVWMVWDRRRQTWHDRAAGTYVVVVVPRERGR